MNMLWMGSDESVNFLREFCFQVSPLTYLSFYLVLNLKTQPEDVFVVAGEHLHSHRHPAHRWVQQAAGRHPQ